MPALVGARSLGVVLAASVSLGLASLALGDTGLPPARRLGLTAERPGPMVHEGEWAADLIDVLGLASSLPDDPRDADRFAVLCPTDAGGRFATLPAPIPLERHAGDGRESWRSEPLAPGRYRLAVYGRGAGVWSAPGSTIGVLAPGALEMDVSREPVLLAGGPAELFARLADGGDVRRAELAPWTPTCIAPAGGWSAARPLRFGAKARTMVLALGALERLPRRGETLRLEAERFASTSGDGAITDRAVGVPASAGRWVEAVGETAEYRYAVGIPEDGLYTILARIHGAGRQVWSVDGRLHVAVVAGEDAPRFAWSEVTTVWLDAGRHTLRARLPRGGGIDVVQLTGRRTDDAAFLAALASLGLHEGAADELVDARAADRNLAALEDLLRADAGFAPGLASVEGELEDLYRRPLSPILPGDL